MKKRLIARIFSLLAMVIFVTGCSSGAATNTATTPASSASQDGATLVQERCSVCHPLTFVERSRHSATEWQTIVNMMVSRGAQLTPQEQSTVVGWLTANFGQ